MTDVYGPFDTPDQQAAFVGAETATGQDPAAFTDIGMSTYQPSDAPIPGMQNTDGALTPAPPISTVDKIWGAIKSDSQGALSWVESSASGATQSVESALGTAVSATKAGVADLTKGVTSGLNSIYWYLILAVIVLGGVIYFAGKSGAVGVRVGV